jgi:hypothetical protein
MWRFELPLKALSDFVSAIWHIRATLCCYRPQSNVDCCARSLVLSLSFAHAHIYAHSVQYIA